MKRLYIYIIMCSVALGFTGCQSDDFTAQKSDEYGTIQFSVQPEKAESRATEYTSYSTTNRPNTMGVWGYADLVNVTFPAPASSDDGYAATQARTIFTNQEVTYSEGKWTYTPSKYWQDYATLTPYDFFAYMPKTNDATLTKDKKTPKYTLSFPVTIAGDMAPLTTNETALICNKPYHTTNVGENIPFQMDQTLTGFNIQFQLGNKMDDVRDVIITEVRVQGAKSMFATGGTVSRVYTCTLKNDNKQVDTWSADDITWSNLQNPASDVECTIAYTDNGGAENHDDNYHNAVETPATPAYLVLGKDKMRQWGSNFFIIPTTGFTPTIEVTYDVTLNGTTDNDGTYTPGVVTRQNVTSNITLNNKNFSGYDPSTAGTPGKIRPIQIKIVPSYLYVLADADQESGYIVIEEK